MVILLAFVSTSLSFIKKYRRKKKTYDISFLLPHKKIDFSYKLFPVSSFNVQACTLYAPEGFLWSSAENDTFHVIKEHFIVIDKKLHGMRLNGHLCEQQTIYLISKNGIVYINGIQFTAAVVVKNTKEGIKIVCNGNLQQELNLHTEQVPFSLQGSVLLEAVSVENTTFDISWMYRETVIKKVCQSQKYAIRVLLESNDVMKLWHIKSAHGFFIWNPSTPHQRIAYSKQEMKIEYKHNAWHLNNKKMPAAIFCIAPQNGYMSFNGKNYEGSFTIARNNNEQLLINTLDIEDYVACVLRSEGWPGWPLEVNKVLAITSRTYALSMILQAKKSKQLYHIKNTNHHQTYHGTHNNTVIKEAVEQTRSMFLAYDNKPIIAMFDICCGGIIPANITARCDFEKAPYLARPYACTFCKKLKVYSWKVELTMQEFQKRIGSHFPHTHLKEVKITEKDKAGLAKSITLKSFKDARTISGQKLYSLIAEVKSYCFDIKRKANIITIAGRGYGHHLGLCQWGAREMVRDGWHFKRILQFYYPGTEIKCLS
jgi:stage II sporulation protein D